jgi:hypothetical protein
MYFLQRSKTSEARWAARLSPMRTFTSPLGNCMNQGRNTWTEKYNIVQILEKNNFVKLNFVALPGTLFIYFVIFCLQY